MKYGANCETKNDTKQCEQARLNEVWVWITISDKRWKTNERPSADPIIQRDTRDNIRILMDTSDDTGIQRQKDTEGHTRWYKDIEK